MLMWKGTVMRGCFMCIGKSVCGWLVGDIWWAGWFGKLEMLEHSHRS